MLLSMILDYQYLSSEKRNYAHGRLSSRDHARMIGMVARPLALVARPVVSSKVTEPNGLKVSQGVLVKK